MTTHPQTYNADSPRALVTAIRAANPGKSEAALRAIFLEYMKSEQGKVFLPTIISEVLEMAAIDEDAPEELRELAQLIHGPSETGPDEG